MTASGADEDSSGAIDFRRKLQETFLLPTDLPVFRFGNAYAFAEEVAADAYLRNVHAGLKAPLPQADAPTVAIVRGNYVYHHYLQVGGSSTVEVRWRG